MLNLTDELIADPYVVLRFEELLSVIISLVTLFLIGLKSARGKRSSVGSILIIGGTILIIGLPNLLYSFTVVDLIHDILILPVLFCSYFINIHRLKKA
jgi:hypothetical protein